MFHLITISQCYHANTGDSTIYGNINQNIVIKDIFSHCFMLIRSDTNLPANSYMPSANVVVWNVTVDQVPLSFAYCKLQLTLFDATAVS